MKDLKGKSFGKWVALEKVASRKRMAMWKCRCECGNEKEIYQKHLLSGASKSCGCIRNEKASERMKSNNPCIRKHNMWQTRLYGIWCGMKDRCTNHNNPQYKNYGGRNIKVCVEWETFNAFKDWALSNGYDDTLTIDRIDVDGNYEPSNCRFITIQEQQYNKRNNHFITYNGKTQTLTEWADEVGIKRNTLEARINRSHWSVGRALGYE